MFEDQELSIEIHMNHIRVCLVFIVVVKNFKIFKPYIWMTRLHISYHI
jgi:hypothetical protein